MSSQSNNTNQGQASQQSPQSAATAAKSDFVPPHKRVAQTTQAAQSNTQQIPAPAAKPSPPDQNTAMGLPLQDIPKQTTQNTPSTTKSEQPAQVALSGTLQTLQQASQQRTPPSNTQGTAGLPIRTSSSGATSTLPSRHLAGQDSAMQASGSSAPNSGANSSIRFSQHPASNSTLQKDDLVQQQLTFFDEEYAQATVMGKNGQKINIRVNRFAIDIKKSLPDALQTMSFSLPNINGRAVKNARVKKLLLQDALSAQQPWGVAASNNEIFTDWDNKLVSKKTVPQLGGGGFAKNPDGSRSRLIDVSFPAQNGTTSTSHIITLAANDPLLLSVLGDYVSGKKPPNFDYSGFTTACNIMVRHFAAQNSVQIRSNRVFPLQDFAIESWGCGLHPRLGFHNSVRPANGRLQLQVNTSGSAFYDSISVKDFIEKYFGEETFERERPSLQGLMADIRAVTKQLQVHLTYGPADPPIQGSSRSVLLADSLQGRLKRITGYGKAADAETFTLRGSNKDSTVQRYFEDQVLPAGTTLEFPDLPVVDLGSATQHIWVPMELLRIAPDQVLRTQLRDSEMDDMAKAARALPMENVKRIETKGLSLLEVEALRSSDIIHIGNKMMQITGRMLPVPVLCYGGAKSGGSAQSPKSSDLQKGKWNLADMKFFSPASLDHFLVIQPANPLYADDAKLEAFSAGLKKCGVGLVGSFRTQLTPSFSSRDLSQALARAGPGPPRIILVIFNNRRNPNAYATIKAWGETVAGIHTVCLTSQKVEKLTDAGFQANLAMKFNAKLGGQNHKLEEKFYKSLHANGLTMVVGADVTHPGPGSIELCPSIAAVVASTGPDSVDYPGSMRLQQSRTEVRLLVFHNLHSVHANILQGIVDMQQMMLERLDLWCKKNNDKLPQKILFYRDGVSEDQFAMVKRHELKAIRLACVAAGTKYSVNKYEPPITLVVCTKRHQDRFYRAEKPSVNDSKYIDEKDNFKPGLVVDHEAIRLPKYFDFWLQSHKSLQGTARPCHYFVLENGIGYTPDDLQGIVSLVNHSLTYSHF